MWRVEVDETIRFDRRVYIEFFKSLGGMLGGGRDNMALSKSNGHVDRERWRKSRCRG
jgi:hypothetical protein